MSINLKKSYEATSMVVDKVYNGKSGIKPTNFFIYCYKGKVDTDVVLRSIKDTFGRSDHFHTYSEDYSRVIAANERERITFTINDQAILARGTHTDFHDKGTIELFYILLTGAIIGEIDDASKLFNDVVDGCYEDFTHKYEPFTDIYI